MPLVSLSRILCYWADRQPDAVAVAHEASAVSFGELERRTNRLARAYALRGVRADDFVTIALPNGIPFFEACFAAWKLGATPQPVSAKLPKFERDQIVEVGNPALVVGVPDGDHPGRATLPSDFRPDTSLADEPLPDRVAASFKAMTSGGSTGRPKLIVAKREATTDPDAPMLNFGQRGSVLIPGPLYHNGPFSWAMAGPFK
jgi:bile acid-coenzyme A ligase